MRFGSLVLLSVFLLSGCGGQEADSAAAPEAAGYSSPVRVSDATRQDVQRTLQLGAPAEAWQSARLAPSSPGRVERVAVGLGEEVEEGQLLVSMDRRLLELQRQQAERSMDLARLQRTDAERELARARELAGSGALTPQNLEKAELGADMARAQEAQAEAALSLLGEQLRRTRITAPFDGAVTGIFVEPGELYSGMAGLGGAPAVVSVASLDPIRLDILVPERDLPQVSVGMDVHLLADAYPDTRFSGSVVALNAAAEPGSRSFRARVQVPNPDGVLRPGMFLRAQLLLAQAPGVLAVRSEAILEGDDGASVFVVREGVASRRSVELGLAGDDAIEVRSGLTESESVVVEGAFGLPDGARVRVLP